MALSGVIMDGRVDVRSKLSAIELLGKYRDYYKSADRDIRVIIESAFRFSWWWCIRVLEFGELRC